MKLFLKDFYNAYTGKVFLHFYVSCIVLGFVMQYYNLCTHKIQCIIISGNLCAIFVYCILVASFKLIERLKNETV